MEDLEYIFDNRSNTVDEAYVKGVFKDLLFQNGQLSAHGEEIFNIIWAKSTLRGNLFPTLNFNDKTLDELKPEAIALFRTMVSQINNSFYNFVNVK